MYPGYRHLYTQYTLSVKSCGVYVYACVGWGRAAASSVSRDYAPQPPSFTSPPPPFFHFSTPLPSGSPGLTSLRRKIVADGQTPSRAPLTLTLPPAPSPSACRAPSRPAAAPASASAAPQRPSARRSGH
ncbi:hypothetical protein K523DRAFT_325479 [Schizophyllum commune Tattone D]|nr:hypothetical protein K523DRAFT_325479 [Schizophyllum commune Tattone D]